MAVRWEPAFRCSFVIKNSLMAVLHDRLLAMWRTVCLCVSRFTQTIVDKFSWTMVVDKDDVGIDAITTCCDYQPVAVSIDVDAEPVLDPSDSSDSAPGSMSSTPAKSDAGGMSASISAGSSDEPSSDFECFRGPYLNTRDLLLRDDEDQPMSGEPGALSDVSSQPEHLVHPSMEECWLVTPPPCFVGNPQQAVIPTSPMEDLLIEHPSMSVYSPRNRQPVMESSASSVDFSPARNQSFPRSASADVLPPQPAEPSPAQPGEMPPPGPGIIPRRAARLNHVLSNVPAVHPSSWNGPAARLRCENIRSFLDRKNRIRAVVGHGHGYRRSQRMTVIHSGMNNSRHCQWPVRQPHSTKLSNFDVIIRLSVDNILTLKTTAGTGTYILC